MRTEKVRGDFCAPFAWAVARQLSADPAEVGCSGEETGYVGEKGNAGDGVHLLQHLSHLPVSGGYDIRTTQTLFAMPA